MSDAGLVERARGGDAGAFSELVGRHLSSAYAVTLAVLLDPTDAEDAAQDALVTALERLNECRQPERFGAWLRQIARNRAKNIRRGRAIRRALSLGSAAHVPAAEDPGRDLARSELRRELLSGLSELSQVQREVVLLHDLEGWKHREIAAALSLPEGTVRSHLSHARRALRTLLSGEHRLED